MVLLLLRGVVKSPSLECEGWWFSGNAAMQHWRLGQKRTHTLTRVPWDARSAEYWLPRRPTALSEAEVHMHNETLRSHAKE